MWQYLDSPDRAVPSLSPNRHGSSPIAEIMISGTEAEFMRMFRLSRTVFSDHRWAHVPYVPNSPAEALVCKNYKFWTSFLNIAVVNSYYCFVNFDVGRPGRFHDKNCTENSNFWFAMNARRETWLGKNGVALADSAWGVGSNMVMTPYIVNDGSTKARKKLPLHAAERRGLPPQ